MGVLSEIVVAQQSDVPAIAASIEPSSQWPGIDWKTLDQIKLSSLWSILEGSPLDVDSVVERTDLFEMLHDEGEDGPWVFGIPDELRDLLSDLSRQSGETLHKTAGLLARTEEFEADGWDLDEVKQFLQELADLADTAKIESKKLFLWIAL